MAKEQETNEMRKASARIIWKDLKNQLARGEITFKQYIKEKRKVKKALLS